MYVLNINSLIKWADRLAQKAPFMVQSLVAVLFVIVVTFWIQLHSYNPIDLRYSLHLLLPILLPLVLLAPSLALGLWLLRIESFANNKSAVFHVLFLVFTAFVSFKFTQYDFSKSHSQACTGDIQRVEIIGVEQNNASARVDVAASCPHYTGEVTFHFPPNFARKWDRGMKMTFAAKKSLLGIEYFAHPTLVP